MICTQCSSITWARSSCTGRCDWIRAYESGFMVLWYRSNIREAVWRCLTSNSPCFLTSTLFSRLQKYRWDLPQVTMMLQSVGWKSTPNTDSLEHWRQRKVGKPLLHVHVQFSIKSIIFLFLTHFNFSQSVLSLPVPDRKDVVIGVIDGTERVSSILKVKDSHVQTGSLFFGCFWVASLPTWRKPGRRGIGQRSLSPERGACWDWRSPTLGHEEPAAVNKKNRHKAVTPRRSIINSKIPTRNYSNKS